jgi:hypothetical protein
VCLPGTCPGNVAVAGLDAVCGIAGLREHTHTPACCAPQEAYGTTLPFPLKYIVPWSQQRDMAKKLGYLDAFKVGAASSSLCDVLCCYSLCPAPCKSQTFDWL